MSPIDPRRLDPPATLTGHEVARRADVDYGFTKKVFRALGFPELADDAVEFPEKDVEALQTLKTIMDMGYPEAEVIVLPRTFGFALSRIADAEMRVFRRVFLEPLQQAQKSEDEIFEAVNEIVPMMLDLQLKLVEFVLRRHLGAALEHEVVSGEDRRTEVLSVGFIDLVGFTEMTGELDPDQLAERISEFETLCIETTTDTGTQVVKVIGDAVMFVGRNPQAVVEAARRIVSELEDRGDLPSGRAGIDIGEVLPIGGDYFGQPVNVASRLQHFAHPGTVVVSEAFLEALEKDVDVSHIGRTRLRGVGTVRAFKVQLEDAEATRESR